MVRSTDPGERHRELRKRLRDAVLDGPAVAGAEVRQAAARGDVDDLPESLREYVTLVRNASYRITDSSIEQLKAAGHSEDEIFDVTIAAALGRGMRGLAAGLRAMRGE